MRDLLERCCLARAGATVAYAVAAPRGRMRRLLSGRRPVVGRAPYGVKRRSPAKRSRIARPSHARRRRSVTRVSVMRWETSAARSAIAGWWGKRLGPWTLFHDPPRPHIRPGVTCIVRQRRCTQSSNRRSWSRETRLRRTWRTYAVASSHSRQGKSLSRPWDRCLQGEARTLPHSCACTRAAETPESFSHTCGPGSSPRRCCSLRAPYRCMWSGRYSPRCTHHHHSNPRWPCIPHLAHHSRFPLPCRPHRGSSQRCHAGTARHLPRRSRHGRRHHAGTWRRRSNRLDRCTRPGQPGCRLFPSGRHAHRCRPPASGCGASRSGACGDAALCGVRGGLWASRRWPRASRAP